MIQPDPVLSKCFVLENSFDDYIHPNVIILLVSDFFSPTN